MIFTENCKKDTEPLLLFHRRLTSTLQRRHLWMRGDSSNGKKLNNIIDMTKTFEILTKISKIFQKVIIG